MRAMSAGSRTPRASAVMHSRSSVRFFTPKTGVAASINPRPLSWHDGQRDMGGVLGAVQDGLQRWFEFGVLGHPPPRVSVTVEAGEVAAGDLYPYPMPRLEDVT